jgi:hypothetical protein
MFRAWLSGRILCNNQKRIWLGVTGIAKISFSDTGIGGPLSSEKTNLSTVLSIKILFSEIYLGPLQGS